MFPLVRYAIHIACNKPDKPALQIGAGYKQQYLAKSLKLEEALEDWLMMLELLQLEDRMKRKAVASQLSIALLVRLLLAQMPD